MQESKLSAFRDLRIIEDPRMEGLKHAEMNEGDDEIRVSPAMYVLLKSDFERMSLTLKVKIFPKKVRAFKGRD